MQVFTSSKWLATCCCSINTHPTTWQEVKPQFRKSPLLYKLQHISTFHGGKGLGEFMDWHLKWNETLVLIFDAYLPSLVGVG